MKLLQKAEGKFTETVCAYIKAEADCFLDMIGARAVALLKHNSNGANDYDIMTMNRVIFIQIIRGRFDSGPPLFII